MVELMIKPNEFCSNARIEFQLLLRKRFDQSYLDDQYVDKSDARGQHSY